MHRNGLKIHLPEQSIQILAMLLERPGELVTREEIQQKLWPDDTIVEFDHSLNAAVKRLRQALGDSADNPRYVETLARRGYRFIAVGAGLVPALSPAEAASAPVWGLAGYALTCPWRRPFTSRCSLGSGWAPTRGAPTWQARGNGGHAPGGNGSGGWFVWHRIEPQVAPGTIRSLAVLPLDNLSGDPQQEYFTDGMTDALIADLGQIGALRIISRTSVMRYKGTRKALPEIGAEGSVVREGNRVRITAQLIEAKTDRHLWGPYLRARPGKRSRAARRRGAGNCR